VTFDPSSPGTPLPQPVDNNGRLTSVACPSSSQCTAVDDTGGEVTFGPSLLNPVPVIIDGFSFLSSVACPSASFCVVVDVNGNEVEGDPTVASSFTVVPIAGANSLRSVSCSSSSRCVAVDVTGHVGSTASRSVSQSRESGSATAHDPFCL
jgi:hypothetical protein